MWYEEAVVYQIYPLGLCGAPAENDGAVEHRLIRLLDWAEHIKKLGADTVLLNPVFDSDRHGYDTRDYFRVDPRLGTNEDLAQVCRTFHDAGLRVLLDGVFNHVGRGFWAFRDVREKRWDSPYKDWFHIDFGGNSAWNDGFWGGPPVSGHPQLGGAIRHRRPAAGRGLLSGPCLSAAAAGFHGDPEAGFRASGRDTPRGLQPLAGAGAVPLRDQL